MNEKNQTQMLNSIYFQIKKTSEKMKNSMEKKEIRQVLQYTEDIISQLKTDFISPQLYYQLFTFIFDEILQIQSYFRAEIKRGRNIVDFYKSVQQCISVLPRVYLMIIVGSLILENKKADINEVLEDLIEACNGVQHPIRGLFVRYFLLKILKDYITDIDLLMINFKEMNKLWVRMNKIEYLSKNNIKKIRNDLKVLLGENIMRFALVLNGMNLNNNGKKLNKEDIYKDKILMPILEILKKSNDDTSQEYILVCLIQVFNEEYNLKNINVIIDLLNEINENVDIKTILIDIMEKLIKYKDVEKLKNIKMKEIFKAINKCIENITKKYLDKIDKIAKEKNENNNSNENKNQIWLDINDKELINIIELQSSFLKFFIHFGSTKYKNDLFDLANKNIDKCDELIKSVKNLNKDNPNVTISNNNFSQENMKKLYDFLSSLIKSPLAIFQFTNFHNLMNYLSTMYKYELSINILNSLINTYNLGTIDNKEKLENLLQFIEPMIQINQTDLNEYLLEKFLYKISKLVFLPSSKDPYEQLEMLQMTKDILVNSNKNNTEYLTEKKLLIYLTNYINCLILLGYNISEIFDNTINNPKNKEKKSQVHIDFCNNFNFNNKKLNIKKENSFFPFYKLLFKEINSAFEKMKSLSIETSLKLYIQCAQMVNGLKFEDIDEYEAFAYEFINNAIIILKMENKKQQNDKNDKNSEEVEEIEGNKKFNYLINIIGAVSKMDIFTDEHFSQICIDLETIAEGLNKRKEQCLSILNCVNLYCNEVEEDTNKILGLIAKAKKYAVYSMTNPENTVLFVNILNEYLRLDGILNDFDKVVKVNDVEDILETIQNYLITMKNENKEEEIIKRIEDYFKRTLEIIKIRKGEKNGKKYKLISNLKMDKLNY